MMQPLSLSEFLVLAQTSRRVGVFEAIAIESLTPTDVYELYKNDLKEGVLLENGTQEENPAYSYLFFEPVANIQVEKGVITQIIGNQVSERKDNPFAALRKLKKTLGFTTRPDVAHLISSAMGFVTYDAVRYLEAIPDRHNSEAALPDLSFNFYQISITFDHRNGEILISTLVEVSTEPEKDYYSAKAHLHHLIGLLKKQNNSPLNTQKSDKQQLSLAVDIGEAEFMQMVDKAREYIISGDAFQIVISRCFKLDYSVEPINIYKALRRLSPAPFMFFFQTGATVIMGASPERLIQVQQQKVILNPIAGTRKRSADKNDTAIADDLLNDKKEVAEHMMLVDLARNDVGSVSKPGSVKVDELLKVKHYSHVSHITSVVSGQLQTHLDSLAAFMAAFPAGTLSGAPKIRAMEIIDELETTRRGLYGGAICRFDYQDNLDSCIAIRMAVLKDGIATVRAGAGIVFDSDPQAEAQETLKKASAILDAIQQAHGGCL